VPTDRESDGLDALLREALERSTVAPLLCPDTEKVAAWHDGALSRADARAVELHVADCPRCRALVAHLIRSELPVEAHRAPLWRRWRLQWVVPLAAMASALAVWIAVPSRDARSPVATPTTSAFASRSADERLPALRENLDALRQSQESVALQPAPAAPTPAQTSEADATAARKLSPARTDRSDAAPVNAQPKADVPPASPAPAAAPALPERPPSAASVQAPAEPPTPAAGAARDGLQRAYINSGALNTGGLAETVIVAAAAIEIGSPDPAVRWRVRSGVVEVSRTGGAQWTAAALPDQALAAAVTAGHSPDRQTCWLVGRAGLVLRSTDGATFVRVPFQPTVDLAGVRAQDGRQAVVTTVDGQQFGTADGGTTWESR